MEVGLIGHEIHSKVLPDISALTALGKLPNGAEWLNPTERRPEDVENSTHRIS